MESVEKRGPNNEKLGDRLFIMMQQPDGLRAKMNLLENNEQVLADRKYERYKNHKPFEPTLPKNYPIQLKRKTDLKNRKLISQIRDVLVCRTLLNLTRECWNIRNVSKII